jgi:signal transduction histidine kinase
MHDADADDEAKVLGRALLTDRLAASKALAEWLAHEVCNPLNCASLQLAVLKRQLDLPGCQPDALKPVAELIEQALRRLDLVFNDVFSLLRPPPVAPVPSQVK